MRSKREVLRESSYKTKDLVIGYQIQMLRSQNETQRLFVSPSQRSVKIDARNKDTGRHSSFELLLADNMALELHQTGALGVPALVNGKRLTDDSVRELGHGSVLQIGGEIIKIKKIETHLGAKGPGTQRVYTSNRRAAHRAKGLDSRTLYRGLLSVGIVIATIIFASFTQ